MMMAFLVPWSDFFPTPRKQFTYKSGHKRQLHHIIFMVAYLNSSLSHLRSRHHRAKRARTRHLVALARALKKALHQPLVGRRDLSRAPGLVVRLFGVGHRRLGRGGFSYRSLAVNEGIKLSIIVVVIIVVNFM